MTNPNFLHQSFSSDELWAEKAQLAPNVNLIRAGVCALIFDCDDRYFFAHHTATNVFPSGAVGTSSEKLRWAIDESGNQSMRTETVLEAWIRSLQEELRIEEGDFIKTGFHFNWEIPTAEATPFLIDPKTEGYAKAINLFVEVDDPDVITFPRRRGEEILQTGFASVDEILSKPIIRPGMHGWFLEAVLQRERLVDQGFSEYPAWIPLEGLSGAFEDVILE